MISYRTFRNWDPPALVRLWNAGHTGRGAARGISVDEFDAIVLAKPYFDPRGLIVAEDADTPIGFVHAGFGPTEDGGALSHQLGVIAMLVVAPKHRRRGIARELVRRAEDYLRSSGSTLIYGGTMKPIDPFYLGLYGGSELPGILASDLPAQRLFESLGYSRADECIVYHRDLDGPLAVTDPRVRSWTMQSEFTVESEPRDESWWSSCQYATLPRSDFELRLKSTGEMLARARAWEMSTLDRAWGVQAAGIVNVEVATGRQNQGVGTALLVHVLRHCRNNGLTLAEVQTMTRNVAAQRLYARLGFREVDRGAIFRAGPRVTSAM